MSSKNVVDSCSRVDSTTRPLSQRRAPTSLPSSGILSGGKGRITRPLHAWWRDRSRLLLDLGLTPDHWCIAQVRGPDRGELVEFVRGPLAAIAWELDLLTVDAFEPHPSIARAFSNRFCPRLVEATSFDGPYSARPLAVADMLLVHQRLGIARMADLTWREILAELLSVDRVGLGGFVRVD